MDIKRKRKYVLDYCVKKKCDGCVLETGDWENPFCGVCSCLNIADASEKDLDRAIALIDGETPTDNVNRPAHYTDGKIEVIDFIEDKKLGFCLGNAIKYISRAGKKDPTKEVEDLKKAAWYINRRIKEIEEAIV